MLRDLAECLIYISETWKTHKSDNAKEVQIRLSRAVGFIIYFLHREIRYRKDKAKDFLHDALNSIMATIFVIVLTQYPKDHEHAPTDTPGAKLISIVLNGFFEKPDKTLLFIRKDIENYQSKDYMSISTFLTSDQCHDFFEESKTFESIKREFCRSSYLEIVSKERYSHAKKLKQMEDTSDYQEKKKYQEINGDIAEKHNKVKNIEEFNRKDTLIWIDHKQRSMKASLKKIYNNLFMWRGVWRNKKLFDRMPEEVPVKIFNFVTKQLTKPILKNMVSSAICYYDEEEGEKILKRENPQYSGDNWRLLNCKEVFSDEDYCTLTHRFFSKAMTKEDIKTLGSSYTSYLEKYVIGEDKKEVVLGEFKCTLLTPMYSKNGKIVITKQKLIFYDSLTSVDEDMVDVSGNAMLDFFSYKKKPYKQLYTTYEIDDIRYAFKRRFLFDKQCVEIIFTNCSSLTLNFKSKDDFTKFTKQL